MAKRKKPSLKAVAAVIAAPTPEPLKHWFRGLPEAGANGVVDRLEALMTEIRRDEAALSAKRLKAQELNEKVALDALASWPKEELVEAFEAWTAPGDYLWHMPSAISE